MRPPRYLDYAFASLWLASGILPLYQYQSGLDLLTAVGIAPSWQLPLLWFASVLDMVIGLWLLFKPGRAVWVVQAVVTAGYTVIALRLPEMWLHPFAPLIKNLPLLAVMVWLALPEQSSTKERLL